MYVALYHIFLALALRGRWYELPHAMRSALAWTEYGHAAVGLFIVLSGYCLTMPIAHGSGIGQLKGGVGGFLLRRARRLLPPYYAALFFSLAWIGAGCLLQRNADLTKGLATNLGPIPILSHLLLVHNLNLDTVYTINSPLWSVATEGQIYLLFPLVLLPLLRRGGTILAILAAFAIGLTPHFLFHGALDQACPWYLGLFALGMVGALISFGDRPITARLRRMGCWPAIAVISGAAAVLMCWRLQNLEHYYWIFDSLIGVGAASLLITCTSQTLDAPSKPRPILLVMLSSRLALFLGGISYSIYLIHDPIIKSVEFILTKWKLPTGLEYVALLCSATPLIIGGAYVFHVAFERPFLSTIGKARPAIPSSRADQ